MMLASQIKTPCDASFQKFLHKQKRKSISLDN